MTKVGFFIVFMLELCQLMTAQESASVEQSSIDIPVMNFDELQSYLNTQKNQLLVINFWATWCAPCVEELHYFEYANRDFKGQNVKVILVSLDFKRAIDKQLIPFIERNEIQCEVILLDDVKMNSWINRVSPKWSGAIPGTWFIDGENSLFNEGKYENYDALKNTISNLQKI